MRLTVTQNIELGDGGAVAHPHAATHEHKFLHGGEQIRVYTHKMRDVRHRAR